MTTKPPALWLFGTAAKHLLQRCRSAMIDKVTTGIGLMFSLVVILVFLTPLFSAQNTTSSLPPFYLIAHITLLFFSAPSYYFIQVGPHLGDYNIYGVIFELLLIIIPVLILIIGFKTAALSYFLGKKYSARTTSLIYK